MNCAVCQRDTSPVTIGGQIYCRDCGTLYRPKAATTTRRRSMDMMSRPASGQTTVIPSAAESRPAAALHQRVKSPHVVDLRRQQPPAPPPKPASPAAAPLLATSLASAPVVPLTAPTQTTASNRRRPAAPPGAAAQERHMTQFTDRFERARKFGRSAQISRFGVDRFGHIQDPTKMYDKFGHAKLETLVHEATTGSHTPQTETAHHQAPVRRPAAAPLAHAELPSLTATQHAAMAKLPFAPAAAPSRMPTFKQYATVTAAVVIMGGYIWLQNYPKLSLQAAGNQAGIAVTLPGFVPSSYSLKHTSTAPGTVTLTYTSPDISKSLNIAQTRTDWDSQSLLDNVIAKASDDYAAVQGEGLTIYLYNNNQAAWVNHGMWYSITGATRLSREQILKIAYSL